MPGQAKYFQVRAKLEPSLGSDLDMGNKTKVVLLKHIVNLMNNEIQRGKKKKKETKPRQGKDKVFNAMHSFCNTLDIDIFFFNHSKRSKHSPQFN